MDSHPHSFITDDDNLNPEEKEKHLIIQELIYSFRSNLSKCKYKKVIEDIESKEDFFLNYKHRWRISELKIRSMLKIVYRKIIRNLDSIPASVNNPINNNREIEAWLNKIDIEIDFWLTDLPLSIENEAEIDISIALYLETIYLYALFYKNEKKIDECAVYLSLANQLIKEYIDFSKDPRTLNICQKIYLFISSLLIGDLDFEAAKFYLTACTNLCFRELIIRLNISEGLDLSCLSKSEAHYLNKLFTNIVISFYQRGACEESLGSTDNAIESYKNGRWFAIKFLITSNQELVQFISDVEKRSILYHTLIKNIEDKSEKMKLKNLKDSEQEDQIDMIFMEKKMNLTRVAEGNYINLSKHGKTKSLIETFNHPEFEYESGQRQDLKNKQKDMILSTTHLVDSMLSGDFKDIIKNMKSIGINKMDKDTHDMLQKKITAIRLEKKIKTGFLNEKDLGSNNSNYNSEKKLKQTRFQGRNSIPSPNPNSTRILSAGLKSNKSCFKLSSSSKTNIKRNSDYGSTIHSSTNTLLPITHLNKLNKNTSVNFSNISSFNFENEKNIKGEKDEKNKNYKNDKLKFNRTLLSHSASQSNFLRKNEDTVQKYDYDEFVFSPECKKKMEYLKNVNLKETKFHKQLLNLKKCEKIIVENRNERDVKQDAEIFFKRGLSNGQNKKLESDVKKAGLDDLNSYVFSKNAKNMDNLLYKVIMSLDSKNLNRLKKARKKEDKLQSDLGHLLLTNINKDNNNIFESTNANKNNSQMELNVNKKLISLEKETIHYNKILNFDKVMRVSNTMKNSNSNVNLKNMDNFVKLSANYFLPSNLSKK